MESLLFGKNTAPQALRIARGGAIPVTAHLTRHADKMRCFASLSQAGGILLTGVGATAAFMQITHTQDKKKENNQMLSFLKKKLINLLYSKQEQTIIKALVNGRSSDDLIDSRYDLFAYASDDNGYFCGTEHTWKDALQCCQSTFNDDKAIHVIEILDPFSKVGEPAVSKVHLNDSGILEARMIRVDKG